MSRILFVTTYPPEASTFGGASFIDRDQIQHLRVSGHHVDVMTVTGVDVPLEIRNAPLSQIRALSRMAGRREPLAIAKFKIGSGWHDRVAELARATKRTSIVMTSQTPALALAGHAGVVPHVHIAHNVDALLARVHDPRVARLIRNERATARCEGSLLRIPANIATLSATDSDRLRDAYHLRQPWVLELGTARQAPLNRLTPSKRQIGFIGKMGWAPNLIAARTLRDEVMPQIREQLSDRAPTLIFAGRGSERLTDGPSVRGLGMVPDLNDFYEAIDLVVLPRMTEATGVSVKLLEAHRFGVPMVAPRGLLQDAGLAEAGFPADSIAEIVNTVCTYYRSSLAPDTLEAPPTTGPKRVTLSDLVSGGLSRGNRADVDGR